MTGDPDGTCADDHDLYTVRHDLDGEEPLSTAVVLAVTEAAGIEPREIRGTLYEVVDPDALDDVFRSIGGDSATGGRVSFPLAGHRVTVSDDGTITVRPDEMS